MNCRVVAHRVALVSLILTLAGLGAGSTATADIGVMSVKPKVLRPGEQVDLEVGCGWCRKPTSFPISLVPLAKAPQPHPCGMRLKSGVKSGLCSPTASRPPREGPFVSLGCTRSSGAFSPSADPPGWKSDLRFSAPELAPGAYALVIFTAACGQDRRGSLVVDTTPGKLLWIARRDTPVRSGVGGVDTRSWIVGGAGAIALLLAAALQFRRRRAA
jgi:hypothetical protein